MCSVSKWARGRLQGTKGLQSLPFLFGQRPSCLWSAACIQWVILHHPGGWRAAAEALLGPGAEGTVTDAPFSISTHRISFSYP